LWDCDEDKDYVEICPHSELILFLTELPFLYHGAKNIRIHTLGELVGTCEILIQQVSKIMV
jgi:hypothetical protein